jgi:hypothetical protein
MHDRSFGHLINKAGTITEVMPDGRYIFQADTGQVCPPLSDACFHTVGDRANDWTHLTHNRGGGGS